MGGMGSEGLPGEAFILLGPGEVSCFKAASAMWDYLCILFIWNYLFFLLVCPCAAPLSLTCLNKIIICVRANCLPYLELETQKGFSFPISVVPGLLLPGRQNTAS